MSAPLIPLYPYQQRWLEDRSSLKAGLWTRSGGKTMVVTLEAVLECEQAEAERRQVPWFAFAAAEATTKEMVRYAAIHSQAIGLGHDLVEEEHETLDESTGVKRKVSMLAIHYEHGSRFVGLPCNAFSIRGRHGNLIGDEAGHWPHADDIWTAAAPIASRAGYKMRLCGTAGARQGPFFEIMEGQRPGWSLHRVDVYDAVRQGAPIDVDKLRAALGSGRRFATECELRWEDDGDRLVPLEAIIGCEEPGALLVPEVDIDEERPRGWTHYLDANRDARFPYDEPSAWRRLFEPLRELASRSPLYLGFDVGRKRHMSSLTIIEPEGPLRRLRAIVRLHKRRFAEQRACLWAALKLVHRGCIDATGIGAQLAEESAERFAAKAEPVNFSEAVKEDLATRVLRLFEDRVARLPRSPALRDSIHSVFKVTTAAGHTRYDAQTTEATGHADDFWSLGLALMAAGDAQATFLASDGPRRWSRERAFVA